jgi:GcrA cell cycle regulator
MTNFFNHPSGWDDARIEQLKQLWTQGLSARAIASELGGVTHNAVIGKARRLCLASRRVANAVKQPRTGGGMARDRRAPKLATVPKAPPATPLSVRRAALEADLPATDDPTSAKGCRWPIGDPRDIATGGFRFCQRTKLDGSPYCDVHHEVSYNAGAKSPRGLPNPARSGTW